MNWDTEYTRDIVKKINKSVFTKTPAAADSTTSNDEDFTAAMNRAMASLGTEDTTVTPPVDAVDAEDLMDETAASVVEHGVGMVEPSTTNDLETNIQVAPAPRGRRGGRTNTRRNDGATATSNTTRTTRAARAT